MKYTARQYVAKEAHDDTGIDLDQLCADQARRLAAREGYELGELSVQWVPVWQYRLQVGFDDPALPDSARDDDWMAVTQAPILRQ